MPAPITTASQLGGEELVELGAPLELELAVELGLPLEPLALELLVELPVEPLAVELPVEPAALALSLEPLALELLLELLGAGALGTGGREAGCDLRGWGTGQKPPAPTSSADPEALAAFCP
jgi:hypothetical protein